MKQTLEKKSEAKARKIITERVEILNKDIRKLVRNAEYYINTVDPNYNLNFDSVTITESRCESCGSLNIEDAVYDNDDSDEQDYGFNCKDCGSFTHTETS